MPPDNAWLMDEQVYLIVKSISQQERFNRWPDVSTRPATSRSPVNQQAQPRSSNHLLCHFLVYKDYYVLFGEACELETGIHQIRLKAGNTIKGAYDFAIGPILITAVFFHMSRKVIQQFHKPNSDSTSFPITTEQNLKCFDVAGIQHDHNPLF
ncbi:hypothetical protein N7540_005195 [Penicillium herquei]|nr:hypothetical protein N7540_005195 [Penicillium herquei]